MHCKLITMFNLLFRSPEELYLVPSENTKVLDQNEGV